MKLMWLDPHKIKIPDVRVTARFDREGLQQFKESVKTTGIDEPIKVYLVGEDYLLSDGLHRLLEALANNLPKIQCNVREGTMEEVLCNNLMSGHLRGKHPVSEMVKVIAALWKEYQWDSEKIAAKTGLTRDYVERLQLISTLTPMCQEALDDQAIRIGHADQLTRLQDPVKQESILHNIISFRLTVQATKDLVDDVLSIINPPPGGQAPPPPPPPAKIRCGFCGEEYELGQIANPNTCQSCSYVLASSIAAARQELQRAQQPADPGAAAAAAAKPTT
jgi:ParB-like chromosome segregation protein Spo0J